ncbi:MAG: hypothetical protein FWH49_05640 [Clostridiales bacterium]|nr:hypothetical protein [Clostridiales bacterium]
MSLSKLFFKPRFQDFELIEKKKNLLREENREYFRYQKELKGNGAIEQNVVEDFLDRGIGIWNTIGERAKIQYKDGNAIIFSTQMNDHKEYNTIIYDNYSNFHGIRFLSKTDMDFLIRKCFVWFCDDHNKNNVNATKSIVFASGEAEALDNATDFFMKNLDGFKDNQEDITFVGGPLMVCRNNDQINGFVKGLLGSAFSSVSVKLYRNKLMPFVKMFAGYFHCYVVGNNIMAESPHPFRFSTEPRIWYIFEDEDIADEWRNFIGDYCSVFAEEFTGKTLQGAKWHFPVYNPKTEPLNRNLFLDELEKKLKRQIPCEVVSANNL